MNCGEDIDLVLNLALASMIGTLILLVDLIRQSRKGDISHKSIVVLLICLCAHPYFWLSAQQDCGARLKTSAALFFCVAFISYLWTQYRERFIHTEPTKEDM
jgi:hypothetical protein